MLSSAGSIEVSSEQSLDRVFHALADKTRRALLARLAQGSAMVTELAEPFDMSLPGVGKHLRVLEQAGLVSRTVTGRVHRCSLDATPLATADQWLAHYEKFWNENLDSLEAFLREPPNSSGGMPGA